MLLLGYYYADGRYGDYFHAQSAYTNLYRVSRSGWSTSKSPTAKAVASIKRAVDAGKYLQIALDLGSPNVGGEGWKPYLRAIVNRIEALDAFENVVAIEVRDEPSWSAEEADQKATAVRQVLNGRLEHVPLGVSLSPDDIEAGRARDFTEQYDYIGAEAYLPIGVWDPVVARDEARKLVLRMRQEIPGSLSMLVIGQSYDRRSAAGSFRPARALKEIQHGTYEGAKEAGAEGIVWFSYGREGGVESYSGLVREHRAIARAEELI